MSTYVKKRAAVLGIPIVDATEGMKFEVTGKQITSSKVRDNTACALVRACEQLHNVQAAFFFRSVAYIEYKSKIVRYKLPEYVQREIAIFDRNGEMAPGEYVLNAVPKEERLDRKRIRDKNDRHENTGKVKMPKRKFHKMLGVRDTNDPTLRAKQEK